MYVRTYVCVSMQVCMHVRVHMLACMMLFGLGLRRHVCTYAWGTWGTVSGGYVCMYVCMYYLGTSIAWGGAESEYVSAAFCGSAGSEKKACVCIVCMYACMYARTT